MFGHFVVSLSQGHLSVFSGCWCYRQDASITAKNCPWNQQLMEVVMMVVVGCLYNLMFGTILLCSEGKVA